MTAISPYAPMRRQSSTMTATSSNQMLRRSSSGGAVGAIGSGALLWTLVGFWRRVTLQTTSEDGDDNMGVSRLFDSLSYSIASNLTIVENMSLPASRQRRGVAAVLRWILNILGGDSSKLGKMFVVMIAATREFLLRSVGVANVILTGTPIRQGDKYETIRSSADAPMFVSPNASFTDQNEDMTLQIIRKDRDEIDNVLKYWFGQASPDGAQKSLWMIASSSQELLSKVDAEISDQFRALIWDLSSDYIQNDHDNINDDLGIDALTFDKDKLQRWTSELFGWQGKIAVIIALDQMSRHVHRHDVKYNSKLENRIMKSAAHHIPSQHRLDTIAFNISKQLQNEHGKEISTGMIPLPMRIFGIMPLRHNSTIDDLAIVQSDIESAAGLHEEMDSMIRRFRKATNRRMNVLQDEARREGKLGFQPPEGRNSNGTHNISTDNHFDDEQILECFPFDADMSTAHEHIVIKTIRNFLRVNNVLQSADPRFSSSRKQAKYSRDTVTTNFKRSSATKQTPTAIVSLSGGVDSMVIASALAYIRNTEAEKRKAGPESVLRIISIHIDYGNRPESCAEAAFVERYSKQLGAEFVCRRIDEVSRGVTARDDYERIAREIRFDLYRQCCNNAAESCDNFANEGKVGIMLGHHRGKCFC